MKRWSGWLACLLIFSLLLGCSNASSYIQQNYPLVDVQGNGKNNAKVYSAENKDVPTVAKELADKDTPKEISKASTDKMFLIYNDKVINIQKDPANDKNSLVEIDSIQYAKENYGSSFLQGYLTATILQSILGGGWFNNSHPSDYRGYSSTPAASSATRNQSSVSDKNKPTTSDRTGTFSSKSSKTTGSANSNSSALTRKNDGSRPSYKAPSTSKRSGSFSKRR
jgi:hypothetical protein